MDMSLLENCEGIEEHCRVELDSHADTCCSGRNTVLLEETTRKVNVRSFTPEHNSLDDILIGSCGGAYDCTETGETYLLVWHESLYFGDRLPVTLVNPNQVRAAGHRVNDCPTQFDQESSHSIITSCNLKIKLKMSGIISYFQ